MGNQIKLQNIDMSKVGDTAGKVVKDAANFVRDHKEKLLGGSLLLALADGIRLRLGRKKDQKAFEENSVKQQKVARMHEAEINAFRAEAEQAHEVNRRIDQLEQIVKNITEEGEKGEQI